MKVSMLCFMLLIAAGWAQAQSIIPPLDQPGRKGDIARLAQQQAAEKFDKADKSKDGKLSREEVEAFPYILEKFDSLDQNKDGFLSWEEFIGHNQWKKESK